MSASPPPIQYTRATDVDPRQIIDFWKRNGITVSPTDNPEEIANAARLNPQLFIVCLTPGEKTGGGMRIIGTVWGTFDGRRGYVAHLAVDRPFRGQGLGSMLMDRVEKELSKMGCYKVHLFVERHNAAVGDFYRGIGYGERSDITVFSKTLRGE